METKSHILLISYPVQGHVNPMLQFSKRLASKGARVTFVITSTIANSMQAHVTRSVNIEIISDGSEDVKDLESLDEYLKRFKLSVSESLAKLIERLNNSKHPPRILVYDSLSPFFTQACVVNAIYYHAHQGAIQMPLEGSSISLPSMPSLEINDLPSFLYDTGSYPAILNVVVDQFSNFQDANCFLCNSFDKLEYEVGSTIYTNRTRFSQFHFK
ncbi:mogroside IE synthase-like [Fagus crenata]